MATWNLTGKRLIRIMNIKPWWWTAVLLCAAVVPAQTQDPVGVDPAQRLARARLLEQQEGDLAAAERAYRDLLAQQGSGAIAEDAALALGSLLWRLGRTDDAKPLLQRVVAAGGERGAQAQRLLEGKDEVASQQREQLQRAQDVVRRIGDLAYRRRAVPDHEHATFDSAIKTSVADLLTMGDAGAAALVGRLEDEDHRSDMMRYHADPDLLQLRTALWRMNSPVARNYLLRVAEQEPLDWQRYLTMDVEVCPPVLAPALLRLLQCDDPAGLVQQQLRAAVSSIAVEDLLRVLDSSNPAALDVVWASLAGRWVSLSSRERGSVTAAMEKWLAAGRSAESALNLLRLFGLYGPPEAARLAWQCLVDLPLEKWPAFFWGSHQQSPSFGDAEVQHMLAALRRISGLENGTAIRARNRLAKQVAEQRHDWTEASVDAILECIELHLLESSEAGEWTRRLMGICNEAQLQRFFGLLHKIDLPGVIVDRADTVPANASLSAPLRRSFQQIVRGRSIAWSGDIPVPTHWKGEAPGSSGWPRGLVFMINLIVHHADAETPAWLLQLLEADPVWGYHLAHPLAALSYVHDTPELRRALRTILVWQAPPGRFDQQRGLAFQQLARLGDVEALALYPRAYDLGLAEVGAHQHPPQPRGGTGTRPTPSSGLHHSLRGRGILWLCNLSSQEPPLHGYKDEAIRQAWNRLLQMDGSSRVWADLFMTTALPSNLQIPLAALPVFLETVRSRFAELEAVLSSLQAPTVGATATVHRVVHSSLLVRSLRSMTLAQWNANPELRSAVAKVLQGDNEELAIVVCSFLQGAVLVECATDAIGLVGRMADPGVLVSPLMRADVELPRATWELVFQRGSSGRIPSILKELPERLCASLQDLLGSMARSHTNGAARTAAAAALVRGIGTDAVPVLLQQLRDPDDQVRKSAQEELNRLREVQEQQRFWQQAQAGVDTTPTGTVAKLLLQADPSQPKARRLLAIQSLGTLGEAAALPYLIDWCDASDPEVAAAARQALLAVHAGAGKAERR
jgi:hypothetical protein